MAVVVKSPGAGGRLIVWLMPIIVIAGFVWIDDIIPATIEAQQLSTIDMLDIG
jgi:hypothetical protein